jgi:DNA-binding response OmpR family regulator
MPNGLPRLLCYGHDEVLLYTRKKILERDFYVETARTLNDLEDVLARGSVQVAVVCHSVPDAECQEMIERLRVESPEVKVLVLQATSPETCSEHSDRTMESLQGPPALLSEVHELMEEALS